MLIYNSHLLYIVLLLIALRNMYIGSLLFGEYGGLNYVANVNSRTQARVFGTPGVDLTLIDRKKCLHWLIMKRS